MTCRTKKKTTPPFLYSVIHWLFTYLLRQRPETTLALSYPATTIQKARTPHLNTAMKESLSKMELTPKASFSTDSAISKDNLSETAQSTMPHPLRKYHSFTPLSYHCSPARSLSYKGPLPLFKPWQEGRSPILSTFSK